MLTKLKEEKVINSDIYSEKLYQQSKHTKPNRTKFEILCQNIILKAYTLYITVYVLCFMDSFTTVNNDPS